MMTEEALLGRIAYDVCSVDGVVPVLVALGLALPSPDGFKVEQAASFARLALTDPLDPVLEEFLRAASRVLVASVREGSTLRLLPPPVVQMLEPALESLIRQAVTAGTYSILASLLDLGYLSVERASE
jgi:hypothetical protein